MYVWNWKHHHMASSKQRDVCWATTGLCLHVYSILVGAKTLQHHALLFWCRTLVTLSTVTLKKQNKKTMCKLYIHKLLNYSQKWSERRWQVRSAVLAKAKSSKETFLEPSLGLSEWKYHDVTFFASNKRLQTWRSRKRVGWPTCHFQPIIGFSSDLPRKGCGTVEWEALCVGQQRLLLGDRHRSYGPHCG